MEYLSADLKRAHVLIVDDDPANRLLLRGVCVKLGVGMINEAKDGLAALEIIQRLKPDMLLLDVRMPRLDGMGLMRQLRANTAYDNIVILVQTGLQDEKSRIECFELGATDVVSQPFHIAELKARIYAHLRSAIAARVLFDFRNRIQAHIDITHTFLNNILPTQAVATAIAKDFQLHLNITYYPHDEIGGDLWHLVALDEDMLALVLLDASAHGLAGAINALRVDCLLREYQETWRNPAALLNRLDTTMARIGAGQLLAGAFALTLQRQTGVICYAGSGIPAPLLRRDQEICRLATAGMPLGSGMLQLENGGIEMQQGDALALFTDGWAQDLSIPPETALLQADLTANNLATCLAPQPALLDDLTLITLQRR